MAPKIKAVPLDDSEDELGEDDEMVEKRIKLIRDIPKEDTNKFDTFTAGIAVGSDFDNQTIGLSRPSSDKANAKQVQELEKQLSLQNTFSNETNRRDEDTEMKKYIEDQLRLRREASKSERNPNPSTEKSTNSEFADLLMMPAGAVDKIDDIILFSLSKKQKAQSSERSEAMLSSAMLNGVVEVDLGEEEKLRTLKATEEAKRRLLDRETSRDSSRRTAHDSVGGNVSTNYNNLRFNRDVRQGELKTVKPERNTPASAKTKLVVETVVNLGDEPNEVEYRVPVKGGMRPPAKGKASDEYCLSKFKRNNRPR